MVKVVVFNKQHKITIPKELAEAKGWASGTKLRFIEAHDGTVLLKEVKKETSEGAGKKAGKEAGNPALQAALQEGKQTKKRR